MDRPIVCLFCTEEGHWRQDCPEAQEYDRRKAEKKAGKQPSVSMVQIEPLEPTKGYSRAELESSGSSAAGSQNLAGQTNKRSRQESYICGEEQCGRRVACFTKSSWRGKQQ